MRIERSLRRLQRHPGGVARAPVARRVDVDTEVDWHEAEKFLKAGFPLDVRADRSSSEIQFGHVQRPTHTNTSWEAASSRSAPTAACTSASPARASRWSTTPPTATTSTRTVRDRTAGTTTTVRLSLLRAPRFPDPETDQGRHRFRYAPRASAPTSLDAIREGALAQPAGAHPCPETPASTRWSPSTTTGSWSRP